MAKKRRKDYTPEQQQKFDRRADRLAVKAAQNGDTEKVQFFTAIGEYVAGLQEAQRDALAFNKASEEMGREDFYKWAAENPLSARAQIRLGLIQQEKDAPKVALGVQYSNQQAKFALKKHEEDQKKHAEWLKWQAEEIAESPRFADKKKMSQARLLKKKHSITDTVDTIRKRLK